jgi:hypothetical protein
MGRVVQIFLIAFVLNAVWENMHAFLYASYKGGQITELILLRASLFDACIITLIIILFLYAKYLRERKWLIVFIGVVVAIMNEWYGLSTSRWIYTASMPIVPFIGVGISPVMQFGITGYLVYKIISNHIFYGNKIQRNVSSL